jgi:hypothetical protein
MGRSRTCSIPDANTRVSYSGRRHAASTPLRRRITDMFRTHRRDDKEACTYSPLSVASRRCREAGMCDGEARPGYKVARTGFEVCMSCRPAFGPSNTNRPTSIRPTTAHTASAICVHSRGMPCSSMMQNRHHTRSVTIIHTN